MDDGIREVAGLRARRSTDLECRLTLVVYEMQSKPFIILESHTDASLSPDEARRLARMLYRLARRVEKREEA